MKKILAILLLVVFSFFVFEIGTRVNASGTLVISVKSKYTTSHDVQIPKGSIDEHLIFVNNEEEIITIEYNEDGRSNLNNIFNNSSNQIRLYSGSITIRINNSKYLISKIEVLGSAENLELNGRTEKSASFIPLVDKVTINHTASKGRSDINEILITIVETKQIINSKVTQLIDGQNELETTIEGEFGQDIQIPVASEVAGSEFKFALVNGVIRNDFVVGNNTIPMTENLEVALVYSKEDKHAVLFIDSNGKLIDNLWVENGEDAIAPNISELSKPGYVVSSTPWLSNEGETSLTGIDSSRVYQLQYESTKPTVTITVNDVEFEYEYNQVVTLESTNEDFTSWVDEDEIVLSTSKTFKFTALVDREIKESTTVVAELPVVTMTKDLKLRPSADQLQTFVGQIELRDGDVLVEHGLLLTKDGLLRDTELTVSNATKARSNVLVPGTNEFMLSVNEEYLVVRAYVIVRNSEGELETFYSEVQYDDVAIVTFDTNGGSAVEPIAVKKGSSINEPETTRHSHEFLGWLLNDEEFNFNQLIEEDIELVAEWLELLPTIEEVRGLSSGTSTEFVGIVTGIDGDNIFVQDNTAAINVYKANAPQELTVGDKVRVKGSRAEFRGLQQIGEGSIITIESSDNALPAILEVTDIATLNEDLQTQRIKVLGLIVKSQSENNLVLTDGTNDILVYAASGTSIYDHIQSAIVGQEVNVHESFIGWFNGLQLTIIDIEDLEFIELSDSDLAQLVLDELVSQFADKSFDMGESVELPIEGRYDSVIYWEFTKVGEVDPTNVIIDGKWIDVEEDTTFEVLVVVTLGEAEVFEVINITILFNNQGQIQVFEAILKAPNGSSAGAIQTVNASDINLDPNIFTVTFTNNNNNNGLYIGNPIRFYAGTKVAVNIADNYIITKIEIGTVSQSGNNSNLIIGTQSTKITSGLTKENLNTNNFTIDTIAQTRITQIIISYILVNP